MGLKKKARLIKTKWNGDCQGQGSGDTGKMWFKATDLQLLMNKFYNLMYSVPITVYNTVI